MKIVIDIDDNLYTRLFDNGVDNYDDAVDMATAIRKGTPLPKGHGNLIQREEAVVQETESFLSRIHKGSLSLMVSSLTEKQALPQEEIDRLYAILNQLKEPK